MNHHLLGPGLVVLVCVTGALALSESSATRFVAAAGFADPAFGRVWARTDQLVAQGQVARSWLWGPAPGATTSEPWSGAPGGQRLVQYFDKSRMEINDPGADPADPFYVTNGLLVVELISGRWQVGPQTYEAHAPACINVSGDFDDPDAPTYASFRPLASVGPGTGFSAPDRTGQAAQETIDRGGQVGHGGPDGDPGARYVYYEPTTHHNIPQVFWDFLHQSGPVIENGATATRPLIEPWFYAGGLPISEAYWTRVRINGVATDVLIQAYERRVLTYAPRNPPAFRVEMGNVGQHYGDWRYRNRGACSDVGACQVFPADNVWNRPIAGLPVAARSDVYINSLGRNNILHPDFGAGLWPKSGPNRAPLGYQVTVVRNQTPVPIHFTKYGSESDPGPYPVPTYAPVQGGLQSDGDRHVFVVDSGTCTLYELYYAFPQANGGWNAGSGAVWRLGVNDLRPRGWTSADAAGLPMLPGFVRYDEVTAGAIRHALSFTAYRIQNTYIWPARHTDGEDPSANVAPMGARFRLKAGFDTAALVQTCRDRARRSGDDEGDCVQIQVITQTLKDYGMILHDTGGQGTHDLGLAGMENGHWNNDLLVNILKLIHVGDFEVVDESGLMVNPNSMQTR